MARKRFNILELVPRSAVSHPLPAEHGMTAIAPKPAMTRQQRKTFNEGRTQALAIEIQAVKTDFIIGATARTAIRAQEVLTAASGTILDICDRPIDPFHRRLVREFAELNLQELAADIIAIKAKGKAALLHEGDRSPYQERDMRSFMEALFGIDE